MEQQNEVLVIDVSINEINGVKGNHSEAVMIMFGGQCDSKLFKGVICSGGVDTQKQAYGKNRELSARYLLVGKDYEGQECKLFIENNGTFDEKGNIITKPIIITDSKALSFLETANLYGTIEGVEGGVRIHIFTEDFK